MHFFFMMHVSIHYMLSALSGAIEHLRECSFLINDLLRIPEGCLIIADGYDI